VLTNTSNSKHHCVWLRPVVGLLLVCGSGHRDEAIASGVQQPRPSARRRACLVAAPHDRANAGRLELSKGAPAIPPRARCRGAAARALVAQQLMSACTRAPVTPFLLSEAELEIAPLVTSGPTQCRSNFVRRGASSGRNRRLSDRQTRDVEIRVLLSSVAAWLERQRHPERSPPMARWDSRGDLITFPDDNLTRASVSGLDLWTTFANSIQVSQDSSQRRRTGNRRSARRMGPPDRHRTRRASPLPPGRERDS
jgi:hypothetical protein